jgi:hypothetical protein
MADPAIEARADQAVQTNRDLYASALESQLGLGETVSELAASIGPNSALGEGISELFGNNARANAAAGLRSIYPIMDKWATTDRQGAEDSGNWTGWFNVGEGIASGITDISGMAYDSDIFAAVSYTASATASDVKAGAQAAVATVAAAAPSVFWLVVLLGFAWLASSAAKLKG